MDQSPAREEIRYMAERNMDAITLLEEDHKKVKQLFREYEGLGDRAMKRRHDLYMKIRHELEVHTKLEETIFYPAVRSVDEEDVAEAVEEHRVVDRLLV